MLNMLVGRPKTRIRLPTRIRFPRLGANATWLPQCPQTFIPHVTADVYYSILGIVCLVTKWGERLSYLSDLRL